MRRDDCLEQPNIQVDAGNRLGMISGGDTILKGAVASGEQVTARVGGSLAIESLQDTGVFDSKQTSAGASVAIGAGISGSVSASKSRISSDYASVTGQSGIQAEDDGFQIEVKGNTDLKGGVIASTDQAVREGSNTFATAALTMSDMQNQAEYKGKSAGINVGSGISPDGKAAPAGTSAGFGKESGQAQSVTQSGISGIAGNREVRTGDAETGIARIFDADKVQKEISAQVQITQAFGREAPKAAAGFAQDESKRLREQARDEPDEQKRAELEAEARKWEEGGAYRIALHTAIGGVAGGVSGAAGAAASASAALQLDALQGQVEVALKEAGAGGDVARMAGQLIASGAVAGLGAAIGGGNVAGAAVAFNVDVNNRQLHPTEKAKIKQLAGNDPQKEARLTAAACAIVHCYAEYPVGSAAYQSLLQLAALGASNALAGERQQLSNQSGLFGYSTTGAFSDANLDALKQLNNTYQIGTRAVGAGQAVLGGLGVAASATTAPVSCATGIGCVANAVVGTVSLDATYAGAKQVVSGNPESTFLNQGLQSLGMPPEAAGLVEATLGIGAAATVGAVVNRSIDEAIVLSKLSAASYQNFATNGVKVTPEVMRTPQAQALVREIQAGNPGMSTQKAIEYAQDYIVSGSTLPQAGVAAPGSMLIKVVPKGERVSLYTGYWMSTQQAQAIAAMTPEQAGQVLEPRRESWRLVGLS